MQAVGLHHNFAAKFGEAILLPDGSLNRAALRQMIFVDDAKRRWLEELLHPLIRIEMQRRVEAVKSPYCIVVIPLLFENKPNPLINRILVVDTTNELQIARTVTRDKTTPAAVETIMQTQVEREQRLKQADDVIENNGTVADLMPQVDKLHMEYIALAKSS